MNFNFTARVRLALARAREEALRLGHEHVGPEHQLLGILESQGVAEAALEELGVDRSAVRRALLDEVRPGTHRKALSQIPYTSRSKKVLEYGLAEARRMEHSHVCTGHVLLGLLREEKSIAARTLESFGLDLDRLRSATADAVRSDGPLEPGEDRERRKESLPLVRIDDASSSSIYEQIVDQIREAVATGALRPGQRLPPVRRMADQLDIAPGTVARAYGELERRAVVVTEGARGTRVAEDPGQGPPPDVRRETLVGLLRPVAVAAFHMGATSGELRAALEPAMEGILDGRDAA